MLSYSPPSLRGPNCSTFTSPFTAERQRPRQQPEARGERGASSTLQHSQRRPHAWQPGLSSAHPQRRPRAPRGNHHRLHRTGIRHTTPHPSARCSSPRPNAAVVSACIDTRGLRELQACTELSLPSPAREAALEMWLLRVGHLTASIKLSHKPRGVWTTPCSI
jgi:hypothetical protein